MSDTDKSTLDKFRDTRLKIEDASSFDVPYVVMNTLVTVVACYGLLSNSPAVVIGAMIIAMLLGPISGVALALVDGNHRLLRKAMTAELGGVVVVLASAIRGGRTADCPCRGAAGAYATISPRLSVAFVGVAIATALVPPLASSSKALGFDE